jgi:hypothetical protein
MVRRYVVLLAGVLIAWGSLAYRFITDTERTERIIAVVFGIGVTVLAVLISRRPVLPKSRGWEVGGSDGDSNNHGDDGGHGSDGGDSGH